MTEPMRPAIVPIEREIRPVSYRDAWRWWLTCVGVFTGLSVAEQLLTATGLDAFHGGQPGFAQITATVVFVASVGRSRYSRRHAGLAGVIALTLLAACSVAAVVGFNGHDGSGHFWRTTLLACLVTSVDALVFVAITHLPAKRGVAAGAPGGGG